MRIRTIKPEFWTSQSMGRLSRDVRLVFIGLWNQADDEGRLIADTKLLGALLFPYDDDRERVVVEALDALESEGCLRRYRVERDLYAVLPGWSKHQRISHPTPSRIPPEDSGEPLEPSVSPPAGREGKGVEGKGKELRAQKPPADPRLSPLQSRLIDVYAQERGHPYKHGGAKDVVALKALLPLATDAEIADRWRLGLKATGWASCSTLAQLGSKWNDLAAPVKAAGPVGAETQIHTRTGEW